MTIETLQPGVLTVAVYYGFGLPFAENSNSGSDIQYIKKFAKENDLRINFVEQSEFDKIWTLPGQDKCDMAIGGINYFSNRENAGTVWSDVYFYNLRSFLIRKNDTLNGPEDLTNKTVSVAAAELAGQEFLTVEDLEAWITKDDIKDVNIIYAKDEKVSAQMVLDGKSFAAGADYSINRYLASLPEFKGLKVAWIHRLLSDGKQITERYEYPVRKASTGLVDALNIFIKTNPYIKYPDPPPVPKFDAVVKGNVDIKQLSEKKYKITFNKIGKFLEYQVWLDSSQSFNENRIVFYQNAKLWIKIFNGLNASLKASNKPLFTPTVVMEIGFKRYLFVLNKAKLNCKGHVVFKVSTKEINSSDKKMLKLLCGHHDRVRFDIDAITNWQTCMVDGPNGNYP
jgi:ABC-type amino acid transport substrate-binding protein